MIPASNERPGKEGDPHAQPPPIPGHQLLRIIGRGSYGSIWLARSDLGVLRAIKVVHRSTFSNDRPFEREYIGLKLYEPVSREHPGLVDVLQVGCLEEEGLFYYVMELADDVDGKVEEETYRPRTMATTMASRGRIPAREVIEWGIAIAEGLEFLHANKLVHRDIKPSNVIFVGGVPKIADLGLVGVLGGRTSFVGTDGFFPPEGPGSSRADIYGLGKVLYEAATAKDRLDFPELPTRLGDATEDNLLLELNQVLLKACEVNPAKRFRSAGDMARALASIRQGKSFVALRRRQERMAMAGWGAVVLAAAVMVLVAFLGVRDWMESRPIDMTIPRRLHSATLLKDGRVLAAGGYTREFPSLWSRMRASIEGIVVEGSAVKWSKAKTLHETEVFDPETNRWSRRSSMKQPRYYHAAVPLGDGRVLVAGGFYFIRGKGEGWTASAEVFHPISNTWSDAGAMHQPRSALTATVLTNNWVLFAGGGVDHVGSPACDLYDPQTEKWTTVPDLMEARYCHTASLLPDGRVIVVGGTRDHANKDGVLASTEIFDPRTRSWTRGPSLREARCEHVAAVMLDGRVLVAGGHSGKWEGNKGLKSVEIYDPVKNQWSPGPSMEHARDGASIVPPTTNSPLAVIGGTDSTFNHRGDIEVFDERHLRWVIWGRPIDSKDPRKSFYDDKLGVFILSFMLQEPRASHTSTRLSDGRILVSGGGNKSGVLRSSEVLRIQPRPGRIFMEDDAGQ